MTTPQLNAWPCRAYAQRLPGTGRPLHQVAQQVAKRLPDLLQCEPFDWAVTLHNEQPRARQEALNDKLFRNLVSGEVLGLANRPENWLGLFSAYQSIPARVEEIYLSLPGPHQPQPTDLNGMMGLIGMFGVELQARIAYVEDAALMQCYTGRRFHELSLADVAGILPPGLITETEWLPPPGVAGTLPELLAPREFDLSRVPSGVMWVNWWTSDQIETLGRERVRTAGWEKTIEAADGSMTLAALPGPVDLTRKEDVDKLSSIVQALDLRNKQLEVSLI